MVRHKPHTQVMGTKQAIASPSLLVELTEYYSSKKSNIVYRDVSTGRTCLVVQTTQMARYGNNSDSEIAFLTVAKTVAFLCSDFNFSLMLWNNIQHHVKSCHDDKRAGLTCTFHWHGHQKAEWLYTATMWRLSLHSKPALLNIEIILSFNASLKGQRSCYSLNISANPFSQKIGRIWRQNGAFEAVKTTSEKVWWAASGGVCAAAFTVFKVAVGSRLSVFEGRKMFGDILTGTDILPLLLLSLSTTPAVERSVFWCPNVAVQFQSFLVYSILKENIQLETQFTDAADFSVFRSRISLSQTAAVLPPALSGRAASLRASFRRSDSLSRPPALQEQLRKENQSGLWRWTHFQRLLTGPCFPRAGDELRLRTAVCRPTPTPPSSLIRQSNLKETV